jgi:hypothetical protein
MSVWLGRQGPNLLQPRLLPARLSILLAAAGVLMALAAGIKWHGAATAQEQAELDLEALQMVNAADRDKPAVPRPRSAGATAASTAAARTVTTDSASSSERKALVGFLAVDWNRRLVQLEKSADGLVSLAGLRVDGPRATVELRGDVASLEKFNQFSTRLLEAGVASVQLQRHEPVERARGQRLAFVASVQWKP